MLTEIYTYKGMRIYNVKFTLIK